MAIILGEKNGMRTVTFPSRIEFDAKTCRDVHVGQQAYDMRTKEGVSKVLKIMGGVSC